MHIHRDTQLLQTVAGHQHATVVLRHPFAVAIKIMQGEHHAQTDGAITHIIGPTLRGRLHGLGDDRRLTRIRNPQDESLLQLVAGRLHLRVGLDQFLDRKTVHP